MRVAFANMAAKTGSSSPGDELMTCNTLDVAVYCSSDSESSRVRACTSSNRRNRNRCLVRKGLNQRNLLVGKGIDFQTIGKNYPEQVLAFEYRNGEDSPKWSDVF